VGVNQEFLKDRIKRFKNYKRVLQKREDEYQEKLDICEAKLKALQYKRDQEMKKSASKS
jgi:response regulator of citrate/malate metabolism